MQLSVIVPVYNAGDYLAPCVESLLRLPLDKEIILVDDGSTDGAVDRVSQQYPQLVCLRQANQGVSAARQRALSQAKGDWVWFVDADDSIEGCTALVDLEKVPNDCGLLTLPYIWEQEGLATRHEAQSGEVPYNLWRCLFRREWIVRGNVHFTLGRKYGEDQEFILRYLLATSGKTLALPGPVYHYTMRPTGAMQQKNTRWRQRHDVTCVLLGFVGQALTQGKVGQPWVREQIKRLLKTISVI